MPTPVSLPNWYPAWTGELADLYFSGSTCVFVVHGNVHDLIRTEAGDMYCGVPSAFTQYSQWGEDSARA